VDVKRTERFALSSILKTSEHILRVVTAILFSGMVLVVFMNVVARYCFSASLPWSEEVSRFMLIYLVFLGAIVAYINNEHLGLDLVIKLVPLRVSHVIILCSHVLSLVALSVLGFGGYQIASNSLKSGWTAPASGIPYGFIYIIVPLSVSVLCIQALVKIAQTAIGFRNLQVKEN
jgi:TRAP-type transport system small permease protein